MRAGRPIAAAVALVATVAVGCAGSPDADDDVATDTVALPEPAVSESSAPPVGTVALRDVAVRDLVVHPASGTVVIAVADRPELLVTTIDALSEPRTVALPSPAETLTGTDDALLVGVDGAVLRYAPDGTGEPERLAVDGRARSVAVVDDRVVTATGDRVAVLDGPSSSGFVDADRLVALGDRVGVLDRARSTVTSIDPGTDDDSAVLRAGDGAADAAGDRFGRMLVTDPRDGELLVYSGDPLILRQRFPVPGAPYAIAVDQERDLAWITLPGVNEVVGLDIAAGEPVERFRFPTVRRPAAVAVDPSSGRVVVGSADGGGVQVLDPNATGGRR